jgi:hypothetical protein
MSAMKKTHLLLGIVAVVAVVFVLVSGQSATADDKVALKGTVAVTKADDGSVKAAVLTVAEGDAKGTYSIALCEIGKKLAAEAAGATATVEGTVTAKGEEKTLKVSSYKVEKKAEK